MVRIAGIDVANPRSWSSDRGGRATWDATRASCRPVAAATASAFFFSSSGAVRSNGSWCTVASEHKLPTPAEPLASQPCERRAALSSSVSIASQVTSSQDCDLDVVGQASATSSCSSFSSCGVLFFLALDFLGAALATEESVMGAAFTVMGSSACVATQARAGRLPCACSFASPGVATETLETLFSWRDAASASRALRLHRQVLLGFRLKRKHDPGLHWANSRRKHKVQRRSKPLTLVPFGLVKAVWPGSARQSYACNPRKYVHPHQNSLQESGCAEMRAPHAG